MDRFKVATGLLEKKKFFKLVCGAGNEDAEEVRRLVFIYTLAGAKCMDVSANVEVVKKACLGIEEACSFARRLNKKIEIRPFINVSIGMKGDPHIRKARIADNCIKCKACMAECPTDAIDQDLKVIEAKCIGCGNCESVCGADAIKFYHQNKDLKKLLEECRLNGVEQMELHAAVPDSESVFYEWKMINEIIGDNYVSMCLDSLHLSDSHLKHRIKRARDISKDRFIIQADGVPMSGGKDDFNTTLQAVSIADVIMKQRLGVKVLLSGGTNNLTAKLARMCDVDYNGVSIGTFARNAVKRFVVSQDFIEDPEKISEAVDIAERLIRSNIGDIIL